MKLLYAELGPYGSGGWWSPLTGIRVGGALPAVLFISTCPGCSKAIIEIAAGDKHWLLLPRAGMRRPIHGSVPSELREDYEEAVLVLNDSPKASAALARRCLQALLELQGAKKRELKEQLEEMKQTLPQYVQPFVDHVRQLGNLSAHPKQSISTGQIVDVEPGEADWTLELLEELFDHYYAKPAEARARQAALRAKLADAGKLKSPADDQAG